MIQYDFSLLRFLKLFRNTAFLILLGFFLVGAGVVIASNYGPDGGYPQEEDGPCCEGTDEDCCDEEEETCPESTENPIILKRGTVKETATDLSIPGPLGGWKHSRSYDSMLDTRTSNNPMYNIQGRRWTGGPQKMYLRKSGNKMEFFLSASNKRTFTDDNPGKANGTFSGPTDLGVTLTKSVSVDYANYTGNTDESEAPTNEIPLGYLVYTATFTKSGKVFIFREKDPTDPCWGITGSQNSIIPLSERTSLAYLTQGLHGETYYYNANGRLGLVVTADPQAYFIKYSYFTTGNNSGKLKKIEVYDGAPDLEETLKIAEAEYKYVDYSEVSSNVGYLGELAQVRVSELLTDGVSWDHKYTQYRYYHSRQGGEYQLKSVFEPDAIERIMEGNAEITAPELLFNRADTTNMSSGKNLSQYASRSFLYYNGNISTNYNISTAWGSENLRSKYGGNDRSEEPTMYPHINLVKSETVNTGCSSCGGSTTGGRTMDYYYMTLNSIPSNDASGNPNVVVYLTVEDTKDSTGTPIYRTIYGLNWHGIELRKAMIENPNASTLNVVCTSKKLDSNGKVIEERPEEAHALVNTNAKLMQFLNPFNGSSWSNDLATLEPSKGIIRVYEYDAASKQKSGTKVKIGSGGTEYYISTTDYNAQGQVAAEYVFPTQTTSRDASDRGATTYSYTYWDNSKQAVKVKTETKQAVPVSQNGTGIAAVSRTFYDSYGKTRWTQDALGVVAYQGYHPLTLQQTLTVRDVDTGSLPSVVTTDTENIIAWTGAVPFQRDNALASAFNMTSTVEYDMRGRGYATTGPDGVTNYTVRDARKTMRFFAWSTDTQKPILPINVTEVNAARKPLEVYQLPPTGVSVSDGKPIGIQGSTKVAWTRYHYGSSGSLEHVDRYHLIPTSGEGTIGTHYYRTTYIHDPQGRQVAIAQYVEDGKWQVNHNLYDWRDRIVEHRDGTAMNAPNYASLSNAAWLKPTSKTIYNGGHAERTLSYFNTSEADYIGTIYHYDIWDRLRGTSQYTVSGNAETFFGPYTVQDFDWRGNVTASATFETEPNWNTVLGNENYVASTSSNRLTLTKNSYDILGRAWKVEARDNVAADFITTTFDYDLAGRTIAVTNGDITEEADYDALGRQIEQRTQNFNILMTLTNTEYDATGRMIGQHTLTLNPSENSGINAGGNNFVRNTQYFWYDNAGRQIVQANYGSGGATWANHAKPTRSASVPEESSASCLVAKTGYSSPTGRNEAMTDPKGIINKTLYDALGRTVTQFRNYKNGSSQATDEDIETRFSYDGLDSITTLTALNPTTGNQITRYLYEDPYNARRQTSVIYPDSNDTTSNGTDQVKTAYYLDGNINTITDQNGTVRTFVYDAQRRRIADHVTTLGNGVDGTVRKISRNYNTFGGLETLSSLDAQNVVLNEVKYEYDANQKLKKLYQSYTGTVGVSTPYLEYVYASTNRGRLSGVVYPSGKELTYDYDNFNRITSISENQTALVSYVYDGAGSPMQTAYNGPGLTLNYTGGNLDRFGRVVNHGWIQGNTALAHILHDYDYVGNRANRYDAVHAANSELYSYDEMNQIKSLDRGVMNTSRNEIATPNHAEAWDFDKTGNWTSCAKNGATENRTHNEANELQGIATHDANGNMVLMPGLKGKYDAWNRLVEVCDLLDNLIAEYSYNGLSQRISKKDGSITTNSFFNERWQEVESTTNVTTTYVWGLRYVDDLIYREKGSERLYSLADPNWNIVALVNSDGSVVERMKYDAFGKSTWLDEDFDPKNASDFVWDRTFTGQVLDAETGLILCRNRYYHTELGRFASRDPIGYEAEDVNIYRYVFNNPCMYTDWNGFGAGGGNYDWYFYPTPPPLPCCGGTPYDPSTHGCCDDKDIYDKSTSCCENNSVVGRVSVWRCVRPVNSSITAALGNWHSYMCCNGPNNNCFNFASGTKKGDPVPKEYITTGTCTEYKVCPESRKDCCDSPVAPWDYSFFGATTCNSWTNACVNGGVAP